jgi:hypothetical protein
MRQLWTRASRSRLFLVVAATSAIALAASSPISSAVSGGHIIGHASASSVATPGSTTASGRCSKATARQVMARYHLLSDPQLPQPIGQVLCGAFAGPGSRAMAASSFHGVCLPYAGWGVFRYANGVWRLVPGGRHDIILSPGIAKSGNNIVEKATIQYRGETICTASGLRARVWHWNGRRLVAGPWKVISTGPKTVHLETFNSPDRKVGCSVTSLPDVVWCSTNPPGPHLHYADLHRNGAVRLCDATPTDLCLQNAITHATVLRVGQQNERRGFRCISGQKGITCTVIAGTGKGKGFLINSSGVTRIGP